MGLAIRDDWIVSKSLPNTRGHSVRLTRNQASGLNQSNSKLPPSHFLPREPIPLLLLEHGLAYLDSG